MQDELVTIAELSRVLKISVRWLRKETEAERIPHLKAGKDDLYVPDAVRHILAERAKGPLKCNL